MKWPEFLQFTPDERKAVLALVIFTAGGALVLEAARRHPEWMPGLRPLTPAAIDSAGSGAASPPADPPHADSAGAPHPALTIAALGGAPAPLRTPPPHVPESPSPATGEAVPRERGGGRPSADAAHPTPGVVDLNQADLAALERLPGIGPAMARRILEDRAARGPYARPEDLLRVKGIGPATLARLRPFLRTSP